MALPMTTPAPLRMTGNFASESSRAAGDGRRSAGRPLEADDARQVHVDHLSPEVPRDVDLRRCATAPCLLDDPVEDFGNAARIAHFLLVADHLLEHRHLVDFLEAAWPMVLLAACGVTMSSGVWFQ